MQKLLIAALLPVASVLFGTAQTQEAGRPTLPAEPYADADAHYHLPVHFTGGLRGPLRGVHPADNTPADNPITDEGAKLGCVLFYDVRLSADNTVSCGTCHRQEFGFSDPERLSVGIRGQTTDRHSLRRPPQQFTECRTDVRQQVDGCCVYVLDHAHALPPSA